MDSIVTPLGVVFFTLVLIFTDGLLLVVGLLVVVGLLLFVGGGMYGGVGGYAVGMSVMGPVIGFCPVPGTVPKLVAVLSTVILEVLLVLAYRVVSLYLTAYKYSTPEVRLFVGIVNVATPLALVVFI